MGAFHEGGEMMNDKCNIDPGIYSETYARLPKWKQSLVVLYHIAENATTNGILENNVEDKQ